ncbi:MAG TPA: JAB domain-containing protein [Cyclobacteriaceae bacterium]|nr:JAB domain-containing protein [Cyclobacteriaceae bacterium]
METQQKNVRVSEIQLSYKTKIKPSERPKVTSSREVYGILLQSWDRNKIEFVEQFKVLLVNRANRVLGIVEISCGCATGTVADPKMIFAAAIKANACGLIMAHNHPSGSLQASQADIQLSKKVKEGGKLLEVSVLDHIIVTTEGYLSLADEGLM